MEENRGRREPASNYLIGEHPGFLSAAVSQPSDKLLNRVWMPTPPRGDQRGVKARDSSDGQGGLIIHPSVANTGALYPDGMGELLLLLSIKCRGLFAIVCRSSNKSNDRSGLATLCRVLKRVRGSERSAMCHEATSWSQIGVAFSLSCDSTGLAGAS